MRFKVIPWSYRGTVFPHVNLRHRPGGVARALRLQGAQRPRLSAPPGLPPNDGEDT
jgi:hypothetical protein